MTADKPQPPNLTDERILTNSKTLCLQTMKSFLCTKTSVTAGKFQSLLKVADWPFILTDEDINLTAGRLQTLIKAANWSPPMLYHCGRLQKPNTRRSSSSEQLLSFLLEKDITAMIRDRSSESKSCASRTIYGLQHSCRADVMKPNHAPQMGDIHMILASRTLLLLPPRPNV